MEKRRQEWINKIDTKVVGKWLSSKSYLEHRFAGIDCETDNVTDVYFQVWEDIQRVTGISKSGNNPSFLACFILTYSFYADHNNIIEALRECANEWRRIKYVSEDVNYETYCACTKPIHQIFYIFNIRNGNILMIGSDCIEKFAHEEVIEILKEIKKQIARARAIKQEQEEEQAQLFLIEQTQALKRAHVQAQEIARARALARAEEDEEYLIYRIQENHKPSQKVLTLNEQIQGAINNEIEINNKFKQSEAYILYIK